MKALTFGRLVTAMDLVAPLGLTPSVQLRAP